ncbi:MAG: lysostaphin resistance A-like protein, partial [Xenococcaceae cyanobacterium]
TKPMTNQQKIAMLVSLYLLAPAMVWLVALVEGASFLDYGLVWQPSLVLSVIWGLGLAVIGLSLVYGLQSLLGWQIWNWQNLPLLRSQTLPILGLGLAIGGIEELVFRGYLFNELRSDYSIWLAATISSLIFALGHLIWERSQTYPQLPGLWLLGIVLVIARFKDGGSLGLAWGLHAGWIWGLSCLDSAQLITYTDKVSPWLSGINKQPLAGLAGIVCLLGTGAILFFFW